MNSVSSSLGGLGDSLQALARRTTSAGPEPILIVTIPAPVLSPRLPTSLGPATLLWDPPSGRRVVGVGAAAELIASGPHRFATIERDARELWARLVTRSAPGLRPASARVFGGFSFVHGAAAEAPWRSFGDARFSLPAVSYEIEDDRASMSVALDTRGLDERGRARTIVGRLDAASQLLEQLARAEPEEGPTDASSFVVLSDTTPEAWRRYLGRIQAALAAGEYAKLVAARCRELELARRIAPERVCAALQREHPGCHRFAFGFDGESVFMGATPETLVRRRGQRVWTQALAGSIAARPGEIERATRALLSSGKDRGEQDLVVEAIRSILAPLCVDLDVPLAPVIVRLRDVLHLHTPISGTLARPQHVLQLAAALHPTPAVGGVPQAGAMDWIAAHEPRPRGWYAGPVGWFDRHGDGELVVAIRSGLLRDRSALLYAGAGIVPRSDADAEYAETELKQRALRHALGLTT